VFVLALTNKGERVILYPNKKIDYSCIVNLTQYINGIYLEDFSAKNFNRPEWKKVVLQIKKERSKKKIQLDFLDLVARNYYKKVGVKNGSVPNKRSNID